MVFSSHNSSILAPAIFSIVMQFNYRPQILIIHVKTIINISIWLNSLRWNQSLWRYYHISLNSYTEIHIVFIKGMSCMTLWNSRYNWTTTLNCSELTYMIHGYLNPLVSQEYYSNITCHEPNVFKIFNIIDSCDIQLFKSESIIFMSQIYFW